MIRKEMMTYWLILTIATSCFSYDKLIKVLKQIEVSDISNFGLRSSIETSSSTEKDTVIRRDIHGENCLTFRSRRPFHPQRLYNFLNKLCHSSLHPSTINSSLGYSSFAKCGAVVSDVVFVDNNYGESLTFSGIIRMKGIAWLANDPNNQCTVSYTASGCRSVAGCFEVTQGSPWWAAVPREDWPEGLSEAIQPLWHEPFGDRQVELVVFLENIEDDTQLFEIFRKNATDNLIACLLSKEEYGGGEELWKSLDDPFSFSQG